MDAKEFQSVSTSPLLTSHFSVEWSEDERVSLITEKGLHIMNMSHSSGKSRLGMMMVLLLLLFSLPISSANDITTSVFGSVRDVIPAAFGDFDSDELTDMFVIRDLGNSAMAVEIMLASNEEPLMRPNKTLRCQFSNIKITSVVPGDFDGDALMDVLVTGKSSSNPEETRIYILWGGMHSLNCSDEKNFLFVMKGEPLALDYDGNMIIDLFGANADGNRTFWLFSKDRTWTAKPMEVGHGHPLRKTHSHAFLDMNGDFAPDLVLTTEKEIEVWYNIGGDFQLNHTIKYPIEKDDGHIGQTLYLDTEMKGKVDLVVPVCFDKFCKNSSIFVHSGQWYDLKVNFQENEKNLWGFTTPNDKYYYNDAITLHGGDFNMDGYPDILASLTLQGSYPNTVRKAFLLENVPCSGPICGSFGRTFAAQWGSLNPMNNDSNVAVFYDFGQDGILDVLLVHINSSDVHTAYRVSAFKNSLDYDANFVKVMVLTGLNNSQTPPDRNPLTKKKIKTFGTNLPGPSISYRTMTQEGNPRVASSSQLPQSAHFSLGLPYSIFGLGRTPNFVDTLTVGLSGHTRDWTQIIPNSQMVVIPVGYVPSHWKAQLFVTPSKLVLMSVVALLGTCAIITLIIGALYYKERREDKLERLQEAHRFHFDAM